MPTSRFSLVSNLLGLLLLALSAFPALAQSRCVAVAEAPWKRHLHHAALKSGQIRISFVGHSTFMIESAKGVKIATDYNDYVVPKSVPTVATMNQAHDTHYSDTPDKRIRHVLRGWNPAGGPAKHNIKIEDVRIRNVPTDTRTWNDGRMAYGNSIFIFETAGLCIAHLGHLHHRLTNQQIAQIGKMDIVFVPVDGSYTLEVGAMMDVLKSLHAPLVIPMHYFSEWGLAAFLKRARARKYEVVRHKVASIVVSRDTIPQKRRVLVLPGF